MPQQDNPAADTLLAIPRMLGRIGNRYDPPAPARVDPSWHNDMVQQANRSFQARQDAERAAAAAAAAAPAAARSAKRVPKRTPARPVAKRR
jgi:hypothetical protein